MKERIIATVSLSVLAVASCAVLNGCARQEHRRKDFGVKTAEFFKRQQTKSDKPAVGLDPEEAALIHQSYRLGLGQAGGRAPADRGSKVLIVEEPRKNASQRR